MIGTVVGNSLTDLMRGLLLLGLVFGAGMGVGSAVGRVRPVVARWRDRRHVARCWRAVQGKAARAQAARPR